MGTITDLVGTVHSSLKIGGSELFVPEGRDYYYYNFPEQSGEVALTLDSQYPEWDAETQYISGSVVKYNGSFWYTQYPNYFTNKPPTTEPWYWSPFAFVSPSDGTGLLGEIRAWHKNFFATTQSPLITSTTYTSGNASGNLKDVSKNFLPSSPHDTVRIATGMLHINYASGNTGLFANVHSVYDANNLTIPSEIHPGNSAPYKLYNQPFLSNSWVECNGQNCNVSDSPFYGMIIPNLNKYPTSGEKSPGQTDFASNATINRQMYLYGNTASGIFKELAFRAEQATEAYNCGVFSVIYIMRIKL